MGCADTGQEDASGAEPGVEDKEGTATAEPSLATGKSDAADVVSLQGVLGLGDEQARKATISHDLEYHGFELEVRPGAQVTIEVTQRGTTRRIDPTLYVFGPKKEVNGYGDWAVAFDDDSGWGLYPRLRDMVFEEGGSYLIVVGTYNGRGRGNYRLRAVCTGDACAPEVKPADPLDGACVFGDTYGDLRHKPTGAVERISARTLTITSELTALEREQIVRAVQRTVDNNVSTVEEAFDGVDAGVVNQTELWDASARRAFVVYEVGAGDNSFGAFFEAGTTTAVADIVDGELVDCTATWGMERRPCTDNASCAQGLSCQGANTEVGEGRCIDVNADRTLDVGSSCSATSPCATGMVCGGASFGGEGLCQPAWMQGRFAASDVEIPDNGSAEMLFPVTGLSSVSMDVRLDLFVSHRRPEDLRITLINPTGTESVVHDHEATRNISFQDRALIGFPGDEDANGIWRLKVVDTRNGETGIIHRGALTLISRWD
ncbi:MAG: proprotein convertase P-domain-containing protein [Myxococcota bacterium]